MSYISPWEYHDKDDPECCGYVCEDCGHAYHQEYEDESWDSVYYSWHCFNCDNTDKPSNH